MAVGEEEGTGKSFLIFINARLTPLRSLWARPSCPSSCFSRAFDYHVAFCLADIRVQHILMHQHNDSEFLLNGTKGNYIKIPSKSLSNGW